MNTPVYKYFMYKSGRCYNDCTGNGACDTETWACECYDGWTGESCDQGYILDRENAPNKTYSMCSNHLV